MEPLLTLSDEEIFEDPYPKPLFYTLRVTVKGIIRDQEGKIALLESRGHTLLPGGGVKKKESDLQAFVRECMEEIGCEVVLRTFLGYSAEWRNKTAKHYQVKFFVADVVEEKGLPTSKEDDEKNLKVIWLTEEEVLEKLETQAIDSPENDDEYNFHFNSRSHLAAFKHYLTIEK